MVTSLSWHFLTIMAVSSLTNSSSFASFVFSLWDRPETSVLSRIPNLKNKNFHSKLKQRAACADFCRSSAAQREPLTKCLISTLNAHIFHFGQTLRFCTPRHRRTFARNVAKCWVSSQSGIPHLSGTFHPLVGQKSGAASWLRCNMLASSSSSSQSSTLQ